jgi:hypothetical protein
MKRDLTSLKKGVSLLFFCVLLLCTNPVFAQDSTGSGQAKITLSFAEKDSVKQVTAKLTNGDTVVKGIDIHFYAKKSFGLLPLEGDNKTTDENGEAGVDFPTDLPGDASGIVTVIARVEDDDKLGNVEAVKTINWGVPAKVESTEPARALWSSGNNAPWPLTITVTSLVAVVWGIIFYMLYQLIAIKKEGRYKIEKDT